jgi:hypothetical protein
MSDFTCFMFFGMAVVIARVAFLCADRFSDIEGRLDKIETQLKKKPTPDDK